MDAGQIQAWLHVAVVHVPVILAPVSLYLLIRGKRTDSREFLQLGHTLSVLVALTSAVAYFTGPTTVEWWQSLVAKSGGLGFRGRRRPRSLGQNLIHDSRPRRSRLSDFNSRRSPGREATPVDFPWCGMAFDCRGSLPDLDLPFGRSPASP